jgi:hypothetical protein
MVESPNIESRLCRVENLQFSSPDYVVQAMSYVKSHIESRLCSPGYVVCEIADFRVQAMSSFRVHAIVVQAMVCHLFYPWSSKQLLKVSFALRGNLLNKAQGFYLFSL